jgi:nitrogen fixation NifU-like protein
LDRQTAIDLILDHYEHPRHYGPLPNATFSGEGVNPGCGDVVHLHVRLDSGGRIEAITFEGQGCTISQAAASLLTELVIGQPLSEAMQMEERTLAEALGYEVVAARMLCVSLGLRVLQSAGGNHHDRV